MLDFMSDSQKLIEKRGFLGLIWLAVAQEVEQVI